MLDLVIRAAQVVDGTGRPSRVADIGVRAGTIVQVGTVREPAEVVVDAAGRALAPGFIDVHTHYDAQVFWDAALTPSPLHGVTTAIAGNCGFTLAPRGRDAEYFLTQMLSRVEGMARPALEQGLPWNWESVADYLTRVADQGVAINVGFLAGHSTIRRHVMGERSGEVANESEHAALVQALHDALSAGALGLSTSDSATHADESHQPVPSRCADDDELLALAETVGRHPGTALQCVPPSGPYDDATKDRLVAMSLAADRPINWNVIVVNSASAAVAENRLEASDRGARKGACITGLVFPTLNRLRINFESGFYVDTLPGWRDLFQLPASDRIRALADPRVRETLLADVGRARPDQAFMSRWAEYEITDVDFNETADVCGRTIGELAGERGRSPFETMLDVLVQYGLGVGLTLPADADDEPGWSLRGSLAADPRVVVGGSDAGAHMDMMCGATYTTSMLAEFPSRGLLPLEEVVRQLTDVPAQLFGLRGRGRIAPGYHADLVMFDPTTVRPERLRARRDLPGGAPRVYAEAHGVDGVWVNGTQVLSDGRLASARPGRVLRSGIDTATVDNQRGLALTARTLVER